MYVYFRLIRYSVADLFVQVLKAQSSPPPPLLQKVKEKEKRRRNERKKRKKHTRLPERGETFTRPHFTSDTPFRHMLNLSRHTDNSSHLLSSSLSVTSISQVRASSSRGARKIADLVGGATVSDNLARVDAAEALAVQRVTEDSNGGDFGAGEVAAADGVVYNHCALGVAGEDDLGELLVGVWGWEIGKRGGVVPWCRGTGSRLGWQASPLLVHLRHPGLHCLLHRLGSLHLE